MENLLKKEALTRFVMVLTRKRGILKNFVTCIYLIVLKTFEINVFKLDR